MADQGLLSKVTGARDGEGRAVVISFLYFFCVLAAYYTLRPVRDEMGVRSGVGFIPWLYTGTFIASLIIAPVFAFLVARIRRAIFVPAVYAFLVANIVVFWVLLTQGIALEITAKAFFVWITVVSVFAVSVFWSFMADIYDTEQARRLYPFIAAGGAIGGVVGSATVNWSVQSIGAANLLFVAAGFLLAAIVAAIALERGAGARSVKQKNEKVGGGVLAGFITVARSPYLLGIAVWVFMLALGNGFAYSIQTDLVGQANLTSEARTQFFSRIDLTANILIPILQFSVTRVLLGRIGIGVTLSLVAVTYMFSFISLAVWPVLGVLVACQIAMRSAQYGLSNPARENLWPVVDREDKYKAKNVIDNAVFRGSDVATAWIYRVLNAGAGLPAPVIALIGAPAMALWFILSLILGRTAHRRAAAQEGAS